MANRTTTAWPPSLLALIAANLLPLVGVFLLDWSLVALLVLYWLEMGVVVLLSAVKVLFAARRSTRLPTWQLPLGGLLEKRGSLRLSDRLPPVYPRNVPVALLLVVLGGLVWLPTGYLFVADVEELPALASMDPATVPTVGLAAVAAFAGRGLAVRSDYLREGRYREVSARMVAAVPAKHVIATWVLLAVVAAVVDPDASAAASTGGRLVLVGIVGAKLAYDLQEYRAGRSGGHAERAGGRTDSLLAGVFGSPDASEDPGSVEEPEGAPTARVQADWRAVLLDGLLLGLASAFVPPAVFFVLVAALLFFVVDLAMALAVVGTVVAGIALASAAGTYLEHGAMEYRVYDGAVVGFDRWLDEPQWRVSLADVDEAAVSDGLLLGRLLGRRFGTATVRLGTREGRSLALRHVSDPDRLVAVFAGGTRSRR